MRIALITEDYYPQLGGIPEHVHNLALEYRALGHTATIFAPRMRDADEDPDFVRRVGTSIVIYFNGGVSRISASIGYERKLVALLREGRYDVVHVHNALTPALGLVGPAAAHRLGIPVVATFHSWFERSYGFAVFRRALQRRLDRYAASIVVSEAAEAAWSRYFTAPWIRIPNGVDTRRFRPNGRRPVPPDQSSPRLLYFHRIEPRNHLGTLIDAMPRILARYPGAELTVAGDGPWRGYYQRRAAPLGSKIRFLGRVSDPAEHYGDSDLYLCPTTRGSFGITLLEAMACGTPIIAADSPGFRSVINGGSEAVMVPHNDPEIWADTAIALMADPARRQAMREAGMKKVERYAWPRVAAEVMEVYESVIGSRAKAVTA